MTDENREYMKSLYFPSERMGILFLSIFDLLMQKFSLGRFTKISGLYSERTLLKGRGTIKGPRMY